MESRCLEYRVISNKNVGPFNIISRNNLVESSSLKPFKFKTIFFFHIRQTLISIEMGKPITLATMEVMLTANVFTYYAGWCDKITGKTIPAPGNLIFLQIYNFIRCFFFVLFFLQLQCRLIAQSVVRSLYTRKVTCLISEHRQLTAHQNVIKTVLTHKFCRVSQGRQKHCSNAGFRRSAFSCRD